MGRVYRAEQPALQREVALKVLSGELMARADMGQRFLREARAMARINHPNVITCFDVGTDDGVLFMALELVSGGDAAMLLSKRGGRLGEDEALRLIRDAAAGLEAVEEAGLLHRDIKPANIFLTGRDSAKLADLGLAHDDRDQQLTNPGAPMGTPAYMSPEQAQGEALDIRSDIYALGATLWCLLMGAPPLVGDNAVATLIKICNEPLPDPRTLRPELAPATLDIFTRTLAKDREARFSRALDLRLACDRALDALTDDGRGARRNGSVAAVAIPSERIAAAGAAGKPVTPAQPERKGAPRSRPAEPVVAAAPTAPDATPTSTRSTVSRSPTPLDLSKITDKQLWRLSKRVHIGPQGLEAWLNLAPEASMPAQLLSRLMELRGVCYGLVEGSVIEASRRSPQARRIVLALGDPPSPGISGRDVHGQELPPVAEPVILAVNDDATTVHALFQPGEVVPRPAVERAVRESGLRFGIDRAAIVRLWEGPPVRSGRVLIAQGRSVREGVPAGFVLAGPVADVSLTGGEVRNLAQVERGTLLATWDPGQPGKPGMDVYGHRIDPRPVPEHDPDAQAGEGTELGRNRSGELELRATVDGYVQQRHDGTIRVIRAVEVPGDLGADDGPVDSDDVVVVRGSVHAGARISSASDVVIMGDLADANIEAGGSIEIHGDVGHGEGAVRAADSIAVDGSVARQLVAGNLVISGTVDRCELTATGDIRVGNVIGGALRAGGSILCENAGDRYGTTTELQAGSSRAYEEQSRLAQLAERRLAAERQRLHEEMRKVDRELRDVERRDQRHRHAWYVDERLQRRQEDLRRRLEAQRAEAEAEAEAAREKLARQRGVVGEVRELGVDPDAVIEVRGVAHGGVIAEIAGSDPIRISEQRRGLRLGGDRKL